MNNTKATLVIIGIAAVLTFATTTIRVQSALAFVPPSCHGCGASNLAPGQEAKLFPLKDTPKDFAPGQEAKIIPPTCIECGAKDFAPGQEGLKAGIIGPELKK
jgi:predicted Zn-ribbon and HTH transcriptional regulator